MSETRDVPVKVCKVCWKPKPLTDFGKNAFYDHMGAKDGKHIWCKLCCAKKSKARRSLIAVLMATTKVRIANSYLK